MSYITDLLIILIITYLKVIKISEDTYKIINIQLCGISDQKEKQKKAIPSLA